MTADDSVGGIERRKVGQIDVEVIVPLPPEADEADLDNSNPVVALLTDADRAYHRPTGIVNGARVGRYGYSAGEMREMIQ